MAWKETERVSERVRFIAAWLDGGETVTALSARFGVSRKTAYKWIERYETEGPAGLHDRICAPRSQTRMTPPEIVDQVVALRRKHPAWGPRKLKARLVLDAPDTPWPAASTIGDILKRKGLVRPRKLRRRAPPMEHPFAEADAPNDVWCIDFKGWWRTGDGVRCEPFTVSDAMSRYLLLCKPVAPANFATVWPLMLGILREYGLPKAIRSDNGAPFGSTAVGGLSRLGVQFVKMGIVPERIEPGCPQQNGRHERMHQTLKREAASPPARSLAGQARRLSRFRRTFNEERPHEALGNLPPATVYTPSPRLWDGKLRSPDYWHADQVRRVRCNGEIKWRGDHVFVSEVLKGEPVGLFEKEEDRYELRYGPILLGHIDHTNKIHKIMTNARHRKNPQKCHPGDRSEM